VEQYIRRDAQKPVAEIAAMVGDSQRRLIDAAAGVGEDESVRTSDGEPWAPRDLLRHVIASQAWVTMAIPHMARGEEPPARPGDIGMMIDDDGGQYDDLVRRLGELSISTLAAIEGFGDTPDTSITRRHPFFGMLNAREWAVFQRVHDEDHIRHLTAMLATLRA
jgi:hypothetical protein